jgi:ferritin-like metal-binding protein YciE
MSTDFPVVGHLNRTADTPVSPVSAATLHPSDGKANLNPAARAAFSSATCRVRQWPRILATLPKMAKAAVNEDLGQAFEKHRVETEGHVERLEQIFEMIDKKPQGKTCAAILGITEEGAEVMKEYKGSPALDAGLLAAAQAVEHYEISRYGTLRTWAEELGLNDAASLLQETLDEEEATDQTLTEIAKTAVNQEAEV